MHADAHAAALAVHSQTRREHVRITLLFALIVVSIFVIMWPVTDSMIDIWRRSSTYNHCYAVIPVALWMAWRDSAANAAMPLRPFWPGLLLIAVSGAVGLLGELASAAVVTHFSVVAMAVATVLTVFGWRWARALAFALGFLFFAVPFGEGLLPVLMQWTADVTIWALRGSGIAVYREGNYFVVPSGSWSIVEACGGVRFLIAAAMTSCIFAWMQYRTAVKRTVFVGAALVVALLANWLRAYVIVLLGHFSGNTIGTGADHQSWGWLIFGAAMLALFAAGMRWTEPTRAAQRMAVPQAASTRGLLRPGAVLAASWLLIAAWPVAAAWIDSHRDTRPLHAEPIVPHGGWQMTASAPGDWGPDLIAPTAVDVQTFVSDGKRVGVYRGWYRGQRQGSELVTEMNRIVRSESTRWRIVDSGYATVRVGGERTVIRTALVRGPGRQFLIWHWYWLAGEATSSDVRVKLQLALQRLTGGSDTGAWVALYTPVSDNVQAGVGTLSSFIDAMSGALDAALNATADR